MSIISPRPSFRAHSSLLRNRLDVFVAAPNSIEPNVRFRVLQNMRRPPGSGEGYAGAAGVHQGCEAVPALAIPRSLNSWRIGVRDHANRGRLEPAASGVTGPMPIAAHRSRPRRIGGRLGPHLGSPMPIVGACSERLAHSCKRRRRRVRSDDRLRTLDRKPPRMMVDSIRRAPRTA
jgi:hypothetical protein